MIINSGINSRQTHNRQFRGKMQKSANDLFKLFSCSLTMLVEDFFLTNDSCKICNTGSATVCYNNNPYPYYSGSQRPFNNTDQRHSRYSGSALDSWQTGRAIDPAPGAWFITKFISFTRLSPAGHSLNSAEWWSKTSIIHSFRQYKFAANIKKQQHPDVFLHNPAENRAR